MKKTNKCLTTVEKLKFTIFVPLKYLMNKNKNGSHCDTCHESLIPSIKKDFL